MTSESMTVGHLQDALENHDSTKPVVVLVRAGDPEEPHEDATGVTHIESYEDAMVLYTQDAVAKVRP